MTFNGILLDSRLKELSIESKNACIGVRTRKLWSFKVEAANFPWVCEIVQSSPCINECYMEQFLIILHAKYHG